MTKIIAKNIALPLGLVEQHVDNTAYINSIPVSSYLIEGGIQTNPGILLSPGLALNDFRLGYNGCYRIEVMKKMSWAGTNFRDNLTLEYFRWSYRKFTEDLQVQYSNTKQLGLELFIWL